MTARAYISQRDMLRRHVEVWLGEETDYGTTQWFGDGTQKTLPHGEPFDDNPRPSFVIREEQARALLDALLVHFGSDAIGDNRQLRKDYEAERARVDRLITTVVEHQR